MASHRIRGRQLSRDTEHRIALRRNLVQSLFEHGKIRTTHPKAKEIKAFAEKLITLARTGTLNNRRRVIAMLRDRRLTDEAQEFTGQTVVQKLFSDIAPAFADRPGGYTRIIKLPAIARIGDGGSLVLLQLLTEEAAHSILDSPLGRVASQAQRAPPSVRFQARQGPKIYGARNKIRRGHRRARKRRSEVITATTSKTVIQRHGHLRGHAAADRSSIHHSLINAQDMVSPTGEAPDLVFNLTGWLQSL